MTVELEHPCDCIPEAGLRKKCLSLGKQKQARLLAFLNGTLPKNENNFRGFPTGNPRQARRVLAQTVDVSCIFRGPETRSVDCPRCGTEVSVRACEIHRECAVYQIDQMRLKQNKLF